MEITNTLAVKNRNEWREWLKKHYKTESDIWFIFYKKGTGKVTITYDEAVEEALCFGWIDSILKSLDSERYYLRFTPRRRSTNSYSQSNIKRLRKLIKNGKVIKEILNRLDKEIIWESS